MQRVQDVLTLINLISHHGQLLLGRQDFKQHSNATDSATQGEQNKTAEQWCRKNQPTKPRQAHEEMLASNLLATWLIGLGGHIVWGHGLGE